MEQRRDSLDGASVAPVSSTERESSSPRQRPDTKDTYQHSSPSVPLKRSIYIVPLVLLYGGAALYAWVIICILKDRPIGGTGYGATAYDEVQNNPTDAMRRSYPNAHSYLAALFTKSESYLRAARVVQSLVSVVTIPLTSAVCSQAAVVYLQRRSEVRRLTLRQSMALADKGWTDIALLTKLFFGGWSRYRSSLLLFALFLNVLGGVISPVQQIFLSYATIKRVIYPIGLPLVTDFTDLFHPPNDPQAEGDSGKISTQLRTILAATSNTEVQPRLWSMDNATLSMNKFQIDTGLSTPFQTTAQNTLANITSIDRPFWAELPSGINTGLQQQQYAPRVNSTVTWMNNSVSNLPDECNFSSDAYYIRYEYHDIFQYSIEICMPGNMSQSPWKNERARQDLHEELYLKMNFSGDYDVDVLPGGLPVTPGIYSKKLTLDTTTGYFELPNYENGQVPGPLLSGNPWETNSSSVGISKREDLSSQYYNPTDSTMNATYAVNRVYNKGPLLNIVMALFGEGSLADIEHTSLAAYANSNTIYDECIAVVPFISLLTTPDSIDGSLSHFASCLQGSGLVGSLGNYSTINNNMTLHATVAWYFWLFSGEDTAPYSDRVQNAFASAAFLAIDTIMMNPYTGSKSINLSYDMGADLQIPSISRAGVIFISVLLGLHLLFLLALSLYSAWIPRWTEKLDSFAMLRIGASISEKVPLLATQHTDRIKALDDAPGWMGNSSQNDIGELCLGGEQQLTKTKYYRGYDTDQGLAKTTAISGLARRDGYSLAGAGDE